MKKKIELILIPVILAVTALAIFGINNSKKNKGGFGGPGGLGGARGGNFNQVYSTKTQEARITTLHDYVITNGEVETQTNIQVFPSIGGKVIEVKVALGSKVEKGQVIARIDPSEPGSRYAVSEITSPISGSVIATPIREGIKAQVSSVITTIGDIENLKVSANIPERYVATLKPGLKAEITLEAYEGVIFPAIVIEVSPVLDAATRTKKVILAFDKKDGRINAGMFSRVKLYTLDYSGAVTVPVKAVVENGDKNYLFTFTDDCKVHKVEVTLGNKVDGVVQVLSGINEGDFVVVEGMLSLFDGATAKDITRPELTAWNAKPEGNAL